MSTLQVENLIGPTSGANANKVIIPSGQTLHMDRVKFPEEATTSGRTITSTTMSSYEEGTWVPDFQNVAVTYTERAGTYTRIGNTVNLWGYVVVSSIDNTDTSYVSLGGMPFSSVGSFVNGSFHNGSGNASLLTSNTLGAAWTVVSNNFFYLGIPRLTNNISYANACNASGRIWFAMSYPTDD